DDPTLSETERRRGKDFAAELSIRALTRAWQILTKGMPEVQTAPRPIVAAEMLVVRLAYAADLPTPDEALRMLRDSAAGASLPGGTPAPRGGGSGGASAQAVARPVMAAQTAEPVSRPNTQPQMRIASFEALVALAREKRDPLLVGDLEKQVRLVRFEDGLMEFALAPDGDPSLAQRLSRKLQEWTGRRWAVALSNTEGAPTLREISDAKHRAAQDLRQADPLVQAVLKAFPGAEVLPATRKPEPVSVSAAELAAQPVIDDDGDIVVGENSYSDEDL
ncbi:MAG: DNA polymerase III subunit gamma/tau, partial [Beijerinckiaceae bacterium]